MHEIVADRGRGFEGSVWIGRDGGSSAVTIPLGMATAERIFRYELVNNSTD